MFRRVPPPQEFADATLADFPDLDFNLSESPLGWLILGPTGTGKTHLAAAIDHAVGGNCLFATARNWLRAMRAEIDGGSILEFPPEDPPAPSYNPAVYVESDVVRPRSIAARASLAALVTIDDYGADALTGWGHAQLLGIFDDRKTAGKPTVITTNLDLSTIKAENERLFDRLRQLRTIALTGKSRRRFR